MFQNWGFFCLFFLFVFFFFLPLNQFVLFVALSLGIQVCPSRGQAVHEASRDVALQTRLPDGPEREARDEADVIV